jgi:2-keto-3-deoxy-L-rhamnonate aldolase RhmA
MRPNRAKATLEEGRPVFAAWCTLADPAIVEMIGHAGYDVCLIDMEHTPIDSNSTGYVPRRRRLWGDTHRAGS